MKNIIILIITFSLSSCLHQQKNTQGIFNPNSAIEKKEYFSILISNCVAVEKNKR